MAPIKVVSMDLAAPDVYDIIRRTMPPEFELVTLETGTLEDRVAKVKGCEYIITAVGAVPTQVIETADKLRMIQHQGVGVDKTDIEAATRRGIEVCITPEGTTIGVAEHIVLLILAVYKNLRSVVEQMNQGGFPMWTLRGRSHEIYGKTAGFVGFGRIARAAAKRLRAFEADIVFYDAYAEVSDAEMAELGAKRVDSLDALLAVADIVSINTPATPETRGMVDAAFFARMKPSAVFINTARGDLVNEQDFFAAMKNGVIAGAGIDVFPKEPLSADNEYVKLPNVILTPHISAGTVDALRCKIQHAFANIQRYIKGEETWHSINGEQLKAAKKA